MHGQFTNEKEKKEIVGQSFDWHPTISARKRERERRKTSRVPRQRKVLTIQRLDAEEIDS